MSSYLVEIVSEDYQTQARYTVSTVEDLLAKVKEWASSDSYKKLPTMNLLRTEVRTAND